MTRVTARQLPLRPFPHGTATPGPLGDHVMGMVVLAWVATAAVERWGTDWMRAGSMSIDLRRPMTAGATLDVATTSTSDSIDTTYDDSAGRRCLVASVGLARATHDDVSSTGSMDDDGSRDVDRIAAEADVLAGASLPALHFDFDAGRDLAFLDGLADAPAWRSHGWAHPAWLGTAVNAAIVGGIDMGDPPRWNQIATEVTLLSPIEHGDHVRLRTRVDRVSRRGRHEVAHLEGSFHVDDRLVARVRNDVVYRSGA